MQFRMISVDVRAFDRFQKLFSVISMISDGFKRISVMPQAISNDFERSWWLRGSALRDRRAIWKAISKDFVDFRAVSVISNNVDRFRGSRMSALLENH